jgi:hypothetical protein
VPALDALASVTEGAQLVNGLAASGTVVLFGVAPLGEGLGFYDTGSNVIVLHPDLVDADPPALAALLAHEAQHAWDEHSGVTADEQQRLAASRACAAGEDRARRAELDVWRRLVGLAGKQPAAHPYEEELNADLAMFQEGSGWYWITVSAQLVAPLRQRRGGHPQFPAQGIQGFVPQQAQHGLRIPTRGPAPPLGGRVRGGARPVHRHLLARAS